jgi:hypothetical protein
LSVSTQNDLFCVSGHNGQPNCAALPQEKAVGDTWELESPSGTVRYEIIAGR